MTDIDLTAIRKLTDAATEGPWTIRDGWTRDGDGPLGFARIANGQHDSVIETACGDDLAATVADAEFIAAARTLVPAMADEIEQLRAEREHMELNPTGTAEWLKNRVNELTAELARANEVIASMRAALDEEDAR